MAVIVIAYFVAVLCGIRGSYCEAAHNQEVNAMRIRRGAEICKVAVKVHRIPAFLGPWAGEHRRFQGTAFTRRNSRPCSGNSPSVQSSSLDTPRRQRFDELRDAETSYRKPSTSTIFERRRSPYAS